VLLSVAVAAILALLGVGVGSAQEGGVAEFAKSVAAAFASPFTSSSDEAQLDEPAEVEATAEREPAPITYPNGFTEGQLDERGAPVYSDKKFVPTGEDAPKVGEIDPCATSADYQKCIDKSFDDEWKSEKPEGAGWDEIKIGDAPVIYRNKSLNTSKTHASTLKYLDENMHRFVTGVNTETRLGFGGPQDGAPIAKIVWETEFQMSGYDYYHEMNSELGAMSFRAAFITTDGYIWDLANWSGNDAANGVLITAEDVPNRYFEFPIYYLDACSSGQIVSKVRLQDGREYKLDPINFTAPPPAGQTSCNFPLLTTLDMPFGWVYENVDGVRVIDSFYTNGFGAEVMGINLEGLENSFVQIAGPNGFAVKFNASSFEKYGNNRYSIRFKEQSQVTLGSYIHGTYEVRFWLVNSQGRNEVFRLGFVEISDQANSSNYYYPEGSRP
jgi:hypothetical protein